MSFTFQFAVFTYDDSLHICQFFGKSINTAINKLNNAIDNGSICYSNNNWFRQQHFIALYIAPVIFSLA